MSGISRTYRNWKHARKFAKVGKGCRFVGRFIEVDGHVELGDYCRLRNNIVFRTRLDGKIIFGDRCIVSWNVIIESGELVQIGSGSGLAENCVIRDGTHMMYGTKEYARYTPHIVAPVIIGDEVWIGSGSYISYGVTIGKGAVVGAGSVVTKSIGEYEVWAGVPARYLAHRTDDLPPDKLAEAKELMAKQSLREDRRGYM
jgi:acetyltransferase-like isoleucine patch superfamily enzyme